jgi:hypothetical protein
VPIFMMDQRQEVDLTDDEVELAYMALADYQQFADSSTMAIRLLKKDFGLSLTHAVCAVAYAKQNPRRR